MSEILSTTTANTEPISAEEAERRLDDLIALDREVMKYLLIQRATELPDGTLEINAIHAMRLSVMMFAYFSRYPEDGIDPYKMVVDLIMHDFLEGRANDVATLTADEATLAQKVKDEATAHEDLQRELGPIWPELMAVIDIYEEQVIPRVRTARLADKIDPGFTHLENFGSTLRRLGIHSPQQLAVHDARLSERFADYREENPDLAMLLDAMRRRVATVAFNGYEQLMIQFDE